MTDVHPAETVDDLEQETFTPIEPGSLELMPFRIEFRKMRFALYPDRPSDNVLDLGPTTGVVIGDDECVLTKIIGPDGESIVDARDYLDKRGELVYQIVHDDGSVEPVPRWRLPHRLFELYIERYGGWTVFAQCYKPEFVELY